MAKSTTILSINAGSSSVKVTLFKANSTGGDQLEKIAAAEISGINAPPAQFTYTRDNNKEKKELPSSIQSHNDAFECILESFLNDTELELISSRDHIDYVCHRVVHGVSWLASTEQNRELIDYDRVITRSTS